MNSPLSATLNIEPASVEPASVEPMSVEIARLEGEEESRPALATAGNAVARARLLWTHRTGLGKALAAGLLVGAVIACLVPPRYVSTLQLMPPDRPSSSGMAMLAALTAKSGGGAGAIASDVLGVKSSGSLFIGILRSRTVEDRLVDRFQLKQVYHVQLDEDGREQLAQNTGVSEDRKSGILILTVSDRNPERARALAAAYVEELNRLVAELSTSSAHRERVFLEERLVAVKQNLDQAARELGEFSSKNATIDVKEQGRAMVEAAATLQGELIVAESQRRALEAIYTPNNVRVRAAQAQVTELRRQLEKLGGNSDPTEDQGKDPGEKGQAEGRGGAAAGLLYPSLRKLPLLGVKYADLYRGARIQEVVFETLTQQCEIAKVQEAKETPSVKLLDEANLPERRYFPPRTWITALGGVAALLGALLWLVGREGWQRTEATDPRKQLAQEIFQAVNSVLPWATPNRSRWQAAAHRVWVRLAHPNGQTGDTRS
jgi:capsule polysaccharide export protein KpsE/RkpR